jgi:hypothetical protein
MAVTARVAGSGAVGVHREVSIRASVTSNEVKGMPLGTLRPVTTHRRRRARARAHAAGLPW